MMASDKQDKTTFQQVLDALMDVNRPFPPVYLHRFSDLDPTSLKALKTVWGRIPVERKRAFLEDLEETAETDTLVSFNDLARHALTDSDSEVRVTAIRLLWEDEDRKLAPIFIGMMEDDPDHQVRATAASALGLFEYLGELEEIPEETHELVEDKLLAVAQGEDHPLVRRRALESLGYSSREEVEDLLRESYERGNSEWLASALFAMGRSAEEKWGPAIMRMFGHDQPDVREEAVRAAGELELSTARDSLMDLVTEDPDEDVQLAAIWSLSQIGGAGVRPLLERLFEETEDEEIADLIEEALENLSFTEDMASFDMLDIDVDQEAGFPRLDGDEPSGENDSKKRSNRKPKK
jgi:HEAT repeat protein